MTRLSVYRIRVQKHLSGSYVADEIYYEPTRLRRAEQQTLAEAGWAIRQSRVSVAREHARLTGAAAAAWRESAHYGPSSGPGGAASSSMATAYAIGAGVRERLAADVLAAADGLGSLRESRRTP